ncbi:MAG TPA: hypothetical protein VE732_04610 [Nitrososphaera sp.]|nr:hypothetical protein [Nitrososphaera sp.]
MPYNDPLCAKCLHPQELHTYIVASLPDDAGKIKRCTVSICPCMVTVRQNAGK